jgi:hypothetical protein
VPCKPAKRLRAQNVKNSEALENVPTAKPFVILSEAKNLSVVLA